MARFHTELARNLRNLFRRQNLKPLLLGAAASGVAAWPETPVQAFFLHARRMREFGDTGQVLGGPAVSGGLASVLFATGRASRDERFREMTYSLAQAWVIDMTLASAVKASLRRERPNGENRRSFYSGHTSNAFAAAAVLSRRYGRRVSVPAYAVAVLIGVSRLEKNKHYLTDITAGAAVGHIIGSSVGRTRQPGNGRITWGLARLPGGVGISIHIGLP